MRHWKRWSRIGIVSRIKIIRESGEWSGAKKTEENFERCRRWRTTFYDLGNVYGCYNGISSIHGKELPEQLSIHCEHDRSHTRTKVWHIYEIGVWTRWDPENHSWIFLSLIGDERIINLQRTKVYVFSDSVLCFGKIFENPESNHAWEQRIGWIKSSQNYRNFDTIDGEPMEFEWNIFPGFTTLPLCGKITDLLSRWGETPKKFTGRILFMSMFNDISCGTKDNEEECLAHARVVSLRARRFGKGRSFIGPGSETKWYSIKEDSPQGIWDKMAQKMMLTFAESGHPVFRATSPLSRGVLKSKGGGKLSIHYCADFATMETVFRTISSVNQLSLYGAVAEMCEEYESCHDRTVRPVVRGQSSSSIVLSATKTEVPLDSDDPA